MPNNSPYQHYNNQIGVRISFILSDADRSVEESVGLMSYKAYSLRAYRRKDFRLKKGLGAGNEALVYWEALTFEEQHVLIEAFGDPKVVAHPMEEYFTPDAEALRFYTNYRFDDGTYLSPEQIARYTTNASVLNAVVQLKNNRTAQRKMRGGKIKGIWDSLISDVDLFNDILKQKYNGSRHTLPNSNKLKQKLAQYKKLGYETLVDGRNKNSNRQVVTVEMLQLWANIYAGQGYYKPNHKEVYTTYCQFLEGKVELINEATAEQYNPKAACYNAASVKTVFNHQTLWENLAAAHNKRSGDNQKYMQEYAIYHKLKQPEFAGSIISVDDRQPPFEYANGQRMWFYNAIDLGSEAFTCWVYGDTKEGIILEFYRQMVRNYAVYNKKYGINMPFEIEGERSLNSSFENTFLQNGAMFQNVRIEANKARAKRIEAYFKPLRYQYEKKREGWLARPFALSEYNQKSNAPKKLIPKNEIIEGCLRDIWKWNNTLHSNQELHKGLSRWQVFTKKQHPAIPTTNWAGILPHLGYHQKTSMNVGRIILQGESHLVGIKGEVATGNTLVNIMRQIEGCDVNVCWLDDDKGKILKALVYNMEGRMVCEIMGDMAYNRSTLERTPDDEYKRTITSAYANTAETFIKDKTRQIDKVTVIETENYLDTIDVPEGELFEMPGIRHYQPSEGLADVLPDVDDDGLITVPAPARRSLKDRF